MKLTVFTDMDALAKERGCDGWRIDSWHGVRRFTLLQGEFTAMVILEEGESIEEAAGPLAERLSYEAKPWRSQRKLVKPAPEAHTSREYTLNL